MDTQAYNEGYQELLRRGLPSEGVIVNKSLIAMWQSLVQSPAVRDTEEYELMSSRIMGASKADG
jgi:hypothetical protein